VRIVVHDFAGHPGQLQLSRELARRGHRIEHQFCASVTTGRGATARRANDPASFVIRPITLSREFARYSPLVRALQELHYGWLMSRATIAARPDIALFANVPTVPLLLTAMILRARGIPYVLWWQDVFSEAVGVIARRRLGRIGGLIGTLIARVERTVAANAAAIVPIADAFTKPLDAWDIDLAAVHVIPNWGAIDEVPVRPRNNAWAQSRGLTDVSVVMYAGTLGLKHDPAAIAHLVKTAPPRSRIVVVSEGIGRNWLAQHVGTDPRLLLVDYQPYEQLADMLGAADVLLAVLEEDASRYSVPSKVLNYLCAGRPILALLPADNAVASIANASGAAIVVPPGDGAAAQRALERLLKDPGLRNRMGLAARRYAEETFDIAAIADQFEAVLTSAVNPRT
jgi:glycosyltransferase involved in cell wall biosynthesis